MRLFIIPVACVLAMSLASACGSGPSDEEVEAKAYEVIGRATPLILSAGLNFEPECQRIFETFEPGAAIDDDARGEMSNSEAMAELEKMEKEIDDFEAELRDAGCIEG